MGKNSQKYRYLRLPVATPGEAAARRAYLIKTGTIQPETEQYACGHGAYVDGPYCPSCGQATVVWRETFGNLA